MHGQLGLCAVACGCWLPQSETVALVSGRVMDLEHTTETEGADVNQGLSTVYFQSVHNIDNCFASLQDSTKGLEPIKDKKVPADSAKNLDTKKSSLDSFLSTLDGEGMDTLSSSS